MRRHVFASAGMAILGSLLLFMACPAFADGIHLPPKADLRIPGIPNQQALIVYRDGVEKLFVQSTVDGNGGELAWIVPVPAEPTEVAEAGRGIFVALSSIMSPRVVEHGTWWILLLGLFLLFWAIYMLAAPRFAPWPAFLMAAAFCLFLLPGLSGNLLRSRGGSSPAVAGIEASKAQAVGNYTVQTLKADTPAALDQWLGENGFRNMPAPGMPVVADYIKNGWHFVAVKLRQDAAGPLRPHPLSITFPAKEPVYPMRLTQLAGTDLLLDLYVISDDFVYAPGLETVIADRYLQLSEDGTGNETCRGRTYGSLQFNFPALTSLMGKEGVITRLRGVLKNSDLDHDYVIDPHRGSPVYEKLYTRAGAWAVAIQWALLCAGLLMVPDALLAWLRPRLFRNRNPRATVAVTGAVAALTVAFGTYLVLPVAQTTFSVPYGPSGGINALVTKFKPGKFGLTQTSKRADIERAFVKYVNSNKYRSRFSDEPFQMEEVPGSAILTENAHGQTVLRAFSEGSGCSYRDFILFPEPHLP